MSTITKELAKLFRKITNSEIDAEGNAHVVLSPADSLLINNARIALASLEAEPVAWIVHARTGDQLTNDGGYVANAEGILGLHSTPLYTAPPAQVCVDEIAGQAGIDPDIADAYMQGYHDAEARRAEQQAAN
ncbi:hypothetical protein [Enterobacter kobei]|uniref:hypothetical protein n=1 Tax=Enterobacter kobei TaxID=208224 RepID=UPI0009D550D9|nr:hypothetical protein B1742_25480 [Enterobacter kobei]